MSHKSLVTAPIDRRQYPKSCRLLTSRDYKKVSYRSEKIVKKYVVIKIAPSLGLQSRLGISASKKFGKSHERNRFKRLIREGFRQIYDSIPSPVDLIVMPRKSAQKASFQEILDDLHSTVFT